MMIVIQLVKVSFFKNKTCRQRNQLFSYTASQIRIASEIRNVVEYGMLLKQGQVCQSF